MALGAATAQHTSNTRPASLAPVIAVLLTPQFVNYRVSELYSTRLCAVHRGRFIAAGPSRDSCRRIPTAPAGTPPRAPASPANPQAADCASPPACTTAPH